MKPPEVLLVDDDAKVLRLLEATLRLKDLSVRKAESAEEAMAALRQRVPDLIISDTGLPDLDGFALLQRVRALPGLDAVPFIFLSVESGPDDVARGLRLGAAEYLHKPFAIDELLARVLRVLDEGTNPEPPRGELHGALSEQPLPDLLRMLVVQRQSGVLRLRLRGISEQGQLRLRDGQAVDGRFGELVGVDALFALLLHREGSFDFEHELSDEVASIHESTLPLLMEGFRLIDEGLLRRVDPGAPEAARMFAHIVRDHRRPTPVAGEALALHEVEFDETMILDSDEVGLDTADFAPAFLTAELDSIEDELAGREDPASEVTGRIVIDLDLDLSTPGEAGIALVDDEVGHSLDVMDLYKTLKLVARRELKASEVQLGTRGGLIVASSIAEELRRETVAGFSAQAVHFAAVGPTGRRFAMLDAGDRHVFVVEVDGALLLTLQFERQPDPLLSLATLEPHLPALTG